MTRPAKVEGFVRANLGRKYGKWQGYRHYILYNVGRKNCFMLHVPTLSIIRVRLKDLEKSDLKPIEGIPYQRLITSIEEKEAQRTHLNMQAPYKQLEEIKIGLRSEG